ncbi:MAG: hypothetical protein Q8R83_11235 [Legionellaceae bacterium]|nr:hypothetical protein [Legionellaceae bacterium]
MNTSTTSINHLVLSFFISLLSVNPSFAAISVTNSETKNPITSSIISHKPTTLREIQPVITFTAGASIAQLGQSQSFTPLDLCHYNYESQRTAVNVLWGGFIGSKIKHASSWELIAGIGYYQPTTLFTQGSLTQGADPTSDSVYGYKYQTQSQQLLAEGKLHWITNKKIQPFWMMGIGATFNKTSNYQTNVAPFLEFTPAFSNHLQTNFTYAVGPGIDFSLTKSFRVGVGYRFTDLGSAHTGPAQIDEIPISSRLKQSHLYANQILAQVTFTPETKNEH